jgi:hypothetical protein
MKKICSIALAFLFLALFQIQAGNPALEHYLLRHRSAPPGADATPQTMTTSALENKIIGEASWNDITALIRQKKPSKGATPERDNSLALALAYTASEMLSNEIDLGIGTLRLDRLTMTIPLGENIELRWKGGIPGLTRRDNHFGLTFTERFSGPGGSPSRSARFEKNKTADEAEAE